MGSKIKIITMLNSLIRWLFILMLAFLPWVVACADSTRQPKPPLVLPFDVRKAGNKVELEITITERQTYGFELQYFFKENDQVDRARVWQMAGGSLKDQNDKWVELGTSFRIKLKIIRRLEGNEQSQFEEDISNPRLSSWGSGSLYAMLAKVLLDPGLYIVSVENLSDAPEFQGTKVGLRISRAYLGK